MAQVWHDLLFAHWPVSAEVLRRLIPPALTLDTFEGQAWLGVVPFRMSGVRLRGLPGIRRLSAFPELNVRTYVTLGGKPGVYFFSLDASNRLAVTFARRFVFLPYYHARMVARSAGDAIDYRSRRIDPHAPPATFAARYRPTGQNVPPGTEPLATWLTERYCLYAAERRGGIYRCEIHHPRWPLQQAEAELYNNTLTQSLGIALPGQPPVLSFARRLEVMVWPLRRVA